MVRLKTLKGFLTFLSNTFETAHKMNILIYEHDLYINLYHTFISKNEMLIGRRHSSDKIFNPLLMQVVCFRFVTSAPNLGHSMLVFRPAPWF